MREKNSIQPLNEISKLIRTIVIFPRCIIEMLTRQDTQSNLFQRSLIKLLPIPWSLLFKDTYWIERSQTNIISLKCTFLTKRSISFFPSNFPKYKQTMQILASQAMESLFQKCSSIILNNDKSPLCHKCVVIYAGKF